MGGRHMLMHVIQHPDGSVTTRQWTPLAAAHVDVVVGVLGEPSRVTYLPAEARERLGPVVDAATVVVDGAP
ncbi:hypothetical protein GCM10011608_09530 [Micromonospora sonchi]|uniref:Uncharacterized protein n=1 Tax=Micromonospora sonchi TaxID=1763543 RepID=A0A917TLV3_9ACTN|nr:hypothetical protein [Micromonospora sonchi]GGM26852.1 hypothetical protein GCM10011608_09530 [Micromonospora sonchi]